MIAFHPSTATVTQERQVCDMTSKYTGPPRASDDAAKQWFDQTTVVDGPFRDLLENYSHISSDQVEQPTSLMT